MSLMNHKIVVKILGKLIQLEGIFLLLPAIAGVLFQEKETLVLAITAVAWFEGTDPNIVDGTYMDNVTYRKSRKIKRNGFRSIWS